MTNKFKTVSVPSKMRDNERTQDGDVFPLPVPSGMELNPSYDCITLFRYEKGRKVMAKTAMIQARIEPELKNEVEKILRTLGMNTTYAISVFFKQIKLTKGIPFDVRIPNEETRKAIEDSRKGRNLRKAKNAAEMFKELGI